MNNNVFWRMEKKQTKKIIYKFWGNKIWRMANIFKFGGNIIWREYNLADAGKT